MNAIIKHGERAKRKNALLDNFLSQASRETSKSIYHVVCDLKNMLDFISTYFWNRFLRYRIFRSKKLCLRLQQKIRPKQTSPDDERSVFLRSDKQVLMVSISTLGNSSEGRKEALFQHLKLRRYFFGFIKNDKWSEY